MKAFRLTQRVRVTERGPDGVDGRTGTVHRLRAIATGAWIRFDEPLPDDCASFPADDDRVQDSVMFPDECEELSP